MNHFEILSSEVWYDCENNLYWSAMRVVNNTGIVMNKVWNAVGSYSKLAGPQMSKLHSKNLIDSDKTVW